MRLPRDAGAAGHTHRPTRSPPRAPPTLRLFMRPVPPLVLGRCRRPVATAAALTHCRHPHPLPPPCAHRRHQS
eukprot:1873723-Prymnesium_polylepis.1